MSSAFNPQSDSQTERVKLVLEDMLRHYVRPFYNDWDEYSDALEFADDNSWNQSIQTSPFKLIYGVHPKSPSGAAKLSCPTDAVSAAKDLAEVCELAIKDAKACLAAALNTARNSMRTSSALTSYSQLGERYCCLLRV